MNIPINIKSSAFISSNAQSYTGGIIKGHVTAQDIKYPCRVSLHERESRRAIEVKQTDMLGNYSFENLAFGFNFFVMATDPAKQYNAVIQDNVVPK